MIITNTFDGKLNLDDQAFRIQNGDYVEALNITRDSPGDGEDVVITNVIGNEEVDYTLPSGTNKVIGSFADRIRNRVYIFIWNSNNFDLVLYYSRDNDTIVKLIENTTDTDGDILNFNPSKKINHIDIIYRDTDGDLLYWTDGNTTPKKINVSTIGDTLPIKRNFIEVAKAPPLSGPTCQYGSDSTKTANALRKKLFQATSRFQYNDFEKSTFSTFSKIPLPIGYYGSDNDVSNAKNNFITITVETGDTNVIAIEIAIRFSINNAWSDLILVTSLNKEQLSIPDNSTYQFLFYNDGIYPPISDGVQYVDGVQVVPLFYWVPQLADCQALANGNVPVYGAITEGYNNYPISQLDVTMTSENVTNVPPDSDPPAVTYSNFSGPDYLGYLFTVTGTVLDGVVYNVSFTVFTSPDPTVYTATYTALPGDTVDDVATGLYTSANSIYSSDYFVLLPPSGGFPVTGADQFGIGVLYSNPGDVSVSAPTITVSGATPTPGQAATEKTWLWASTYIFGLVYVDEQNRDMPGVTTFQNATGGDNDFSVDTPVFSEDTGEAQTPVIYASINHLPPAGAVKYYWVRRRQTYADFLFYETCDYQDPSDGFLYFCLANIEQFKEDNSQFIYGTAPINPESRIKIIAGITTNAYDGNVYTEDYQILGTVTRTLTGGSSPANDKLFIKVTKPTDPLSGTYQANMLVMIYTPASNPTTLADSVYYEWGESYDIYFPQTIRYSSLTSQFDIGEIITGGTSGATATICEDDGTQLMVIKIISGTFIVGEVITGSTTGATGQIVTVTVSSVAYHSGMDQNQTANQTADFTWVEGDVYFHTRTMYNELLSDPFDSDTVSLMDANYSDFFDSAVNDNGRAQAIEVNAQQLYNPVLVRFGGAYQAGTSVNKTSDFYFENFEEADRRFGDIRKLYIRDRYMRCYQKFQIGIFPILLQIIRDTAGNPLEANSDTLINKINYPYSGNYGIGDVPESFAADNYSDYFVDNYRGVVCRLSQDGITVLSVVYNCNSFFANKLPLFRKSLNNGNPASGQVYTGDATVYGLFEAKTNKYIVSLEEINRYDGDGNLIFHQDPYTLSFNETRDKKEGFESMLSFYPENMVCIDVLSIAFKSGVLWKFTEDAPRCNFFGVQYDAYITGAFNENSLEKKTWQSLTELASDVWECPIIYSNTNSYAGQRQETALVTENFRNLEGNFHASFRRDQNSIGGLINGGYIKGNFIVIRFMKRSASSLVYLNGVSVKYITSPVTVK